MLWLKSPFWMLMGLLNLIFIRINGVNEWYIDFAFIRINTINEFNQILKIELS